MKKFLLTSLLALGVLSSGFTQNFWNLVNNSQTTYHFGMADDGTVYGATNQIFLYKSTTNGTIGSWDQLTGFPTSYNYNLFVKGNTVFMLNGGGVNFEGDRKSTRLNSSHVRISYAVFCLKKKI